MLKKLMLSFVVCGGLVHGMNENVTRNDSSGDNILNASAGNDIIDPSVDNDILNASIDMRKLRLGGYPADFDARVTRRIHYVIHAMDGFDYTSSRGFIRFLKKAHDNFEKLSDEERIAFPYFLRYLTGWMPDETGALDSRPEVIDFALLLLGRQAVYGHSSMEDFRDYFRDN